MIELQGKFAKAKVYTEMIEEEAVAQIIDFCNHPMAKDAQVRIMPDCHAGKGCTIGFTAKLSQKMLVPNLVGVDISCGVMTSIFKAKDIDFKALDTFIDANVPHGRTVREEMHSKLKGSSRAIADLVMEVVANTNIGNLDYHLNSIGSLGGGNHYIEVGIISDDLFALSVHTGSRNLGKMVCQHYQSKASVVSFDERNQLLAMHKVVKTAEEHQEIQHKIANLPKVSEAMAFLINEHYDSYIDNMLKIEKIANANRACISEDILSFLNADVVESFDTTHNYIEVRANGEVIIRKGAIRAEKGEKVAIPLNMRDGVIIGVGKGNPDWNYSAPHGAGRLMSRSKAKEKISMDEFTQSMKKISSWSVTESTLDEAPQAYKPADMIIDAITDTVEIQTIAKPLFNFKSR